MPIPLTELTVVVVTGRGALVGLMLPRLRALFDAAEYAAGAVAT